MAVQSKQENTHVNSCRVDVNVQRGYTSQSYDHLLPVCFTVSFIVWELY